MKPFSLPPTQERRFLPGVLELRASGGETDTQNTVRGYAAKFGQLSENFGTESRQFQEVIQPGAFDGANMDDVRAFFNHEPSLILARCKNGQGTLRLGVDAVGLWYEFEAPDTQTGRDLRESIRRGDVDQSSFAFTVADDGQIWEETISEDGTSQTLRTITKIAVVYDVSPVTAPAYTDTTVSLRSLEEFRQAHSATPPPESLGENHDIAHRQRALALMDKTCRNNTTH